MIISKAIELLNDLAKSFTYEDLPDTVDATQLGIEALKAVTKYRRWPGTTISELLPGETMPERGIG